MSTALTDELRRLAFLEDLPVCAQAADEIERLRGLVEGLHCGGPVCVASGLDGFLRWGWQCSCQFGIQHGAWVDYNAAKAEHAAHVRQILDGGGA